MTIYFPIDSQYWTKEIETDLTKKGIFYTTNYLEKHRKEKEVFDKKLEYIFSLKSNDN